MHSSDKHSIGTNDFFLYKLEKIFSHLCEVSINFELSCQVTQIDLHTIERYHIVLNIPSKTQIIHEENTKEIKA